jgi:serine/threonine protein kinase/tetratricopeptide (TPR) repeat protein
MIGETASHYHVLERLGGGGMGEVFLAEDLRLHRPVALKMLRPEAHGDAAARGRLLSEARAASALNHPNIAVIYDVDELDRGQGPTRYIAMEYVAGRTLAQLDAEKGLELDAVLDLALQVADALGEAHARGVVHRDLKPTNVMVTESGRVKVLDFGLAKYHVLPSDMESTWSRDPARGPEDGALMGTIAYMAPEQALGHDVDGRADVFSLGVVLYELLTGRAPFTGRNAVQVLDALLHQGPPPLVPRRPDPRMGEVERVIHRMLAKSPEERYPTMRELAEDLAALRRGATLPSVRALAPPVPAVAVMSFTNITRSHEDDWLGTGIAETVTADLKKVEGLAVVSRERVHEMLRRLGAPGGEADEELAVRVGRELGARWVLLGGFQRAGELLRVTARLTEVETGTIVRTVKIDGRLDEVFDLQDRIVRELSTGLRLGLAPAGLPEETQVVEAYEAFSRGVINLRLETYEALDRAAFLFERAVQLDPGYARAHVELGSAYYNKADYLGIPELHERALESYRRALALRPGLVRAWREMGGVLVSLGREDEGIEAIRRALDLDPDDAGALSAMARALFIGRARFREAAEYYEKALARNPQGGWYALQLSHCYALLREFERGEAAAARAVELQEAFLFGREGVAIVGAHMRRGHLAALQDRHEAALDSFRRELAFLQKVDHALRSRIVIELSLRMGASHLRLGRRDEAEVAFAAALAGFEQRLRQGADDPFTRYYVGCVHALRGETEPALDCLERAARGRRRFTIERARIEPDLAGLRDEPRFQELLRSERSHGGAETRREPKTRETDPASA